MKYAITGPRGAIFRIVDEELQDAQYFVQITEEQAETVNAGEGRFFLIDGELKTQQEVFAELRWNEEAGSWEPKPPPPPPVRVEAYKVLGHLGKTYGVSESDLEDFIKLKIPAGPDQVAALNELKRTQWFELAHPLIAEVAVEIGITDIPKFFRDAENYKYL